MFLQKFVFGSTSFASQMLLVFRHAGDSAWEWDDSDDAWLHPHSSYCRAFRRVNLVGRWRGFRREVKIGRPCEIAMQRIEATFWIQICLSVSKNSFTVHCPCFHLDVRSEYDACFGCFCGHALTIPTDNILVDYQSRSRQILKAAWKVCHTFRRHPALHIAAASTTLCHFLWFYDSDSDLY